MRYLVDARTIWVLALLASVSIALAGASAIFTVEARSETKRARVVIARADSLIAEWVKRGCAPRSSPLP